MSSPFCDVVGCRRPSVEDCPIFGTSYCLAHRRFHLEYQCAPGHPSLSTGNGGSVAPQGFVPQLVATGGNGHSSVGTGAPDGAPVPPNGNATCYFLCGGIHVDGWKVVGVVLIVAGIVILYARRWPGVILLGLGIALLVFA